MELWSVRVFFLYMVVARRNGHLWSNGEVLTCHYSKGVGKM
jgi:hypothetical protein